MLLQEGRKSQIEPEQRQDRQQRVLVTGGAGFIGSHLVEALLQQNNNVVVIDSYEFDIERKRQNIAEARALKYRGTLTVIEGDLNDDHILDSLQGEFDTIYHLAARPGVRPSFQDPVAYVECNVTGTTRILQWASRHKSVRFVFASSSSVYGDAAEVPFVEGKGADIPISPYAATKRAAELMCTTFSQAYGIRVAIMRLFTVYGRRQRPDLAICKFISQAIHDKPISLYGDGSTMRDYTHVSDIVAGLISADSWLQASPPGTWETFNLGSGRAYSLLEMVQAVERSTMCRVQVVHDHLRRGDVVRTWANIDKAGATLGYEPKVRFQEGIDDMVVWLRHIHGNENRPD
ncbi:Putative NAD(P)-binding domain, NAD(P)-binding domain superfamily [Septoria linicola]|uniref:NAD(P)-binding domain, NAD(P)-binding domain superfamily n=1 Tax=Septoria linicola TaxID=215465 RepID=A0A9Q9AFC6_9PEZI|nr:Putative NAD(P)-binding domain, NAD(P)-binding domain superfamily [Septoria linicola]